MNIENKTAALLSEVRHAKTPERLRQIAEQLEQLGQWDRAADVRKDAVQMERSMAEAACR